MESNEIDKQKLISAFLNLIINKMTNIKNHPLIIDIAKTLEDYLNLHPEKLPASESKDSMWIISPALAISDIENYNEEKPFIDERKWSFEFSKKGAESEDANYYRPKDYRYLIKFEVGMNRAFKILSAKLLD